MTIWNEGVAKCSKSGFTALLARGCDLGYWGFAPAPSVVLSVCTGQRRAEVYSVGTRKVEPLPVLPSTRTVVGIIFNATKPPHRTLIRHGTF